MAPRKPPPPRPRNPVAKGDAARSRKAGVIPPKKGKGTPYDKSGRKPVDPDGDQD